MKKIAALTLGLALSFSTEAKVPVSHAGDKSESSGAVAPSVYLDRTHGLHKFFCNDQSLLVAASNGTHAPIGVGDALPIAWDVYKAVNGELEKTFEKSYPTPKEGEFLTRLAPIGGGKWLAVNFTDKNHKSRIALVKTKDKTEFPDLTKHVKAGETIDFVSSPRSENFYLAEVRDDQSSVVAAVIFDLEKKTSRRIDGNFISMEGLSADGQLFLAQTVGGYRVVRNDGSQLYPVQGTADRQNPLRAAELTPSHDGKSYFAIAKGGKFDELVTFSGPGLAQITSVPIQSNRFEHAGYFPVQDGKLILASRHTEDHGPESTGEFDIFEGATGQKLGSFLGQPGNVMANCGNYLLVEKASPLGGDDTYWSSVHQMGIAPLLKKVLAYAGVPSTKDLAEDFRSQAALPRYRASRYLESHADRRKGVLDPLYDGRDIQPDELTFLEGLAETWESGNSTERRVATTRVEAMAKTMSPDTFKDKVVPVLTALLSAKDKELGYQASTIIKKWESERQLTKAELQTRLATLAP